MLRRARSLPTPLLAVACIGLGGCGGGDTPTSSDNPTSMAAVKKCLEDNGVGKLGGAQRPNAEDTDAPDRGELITQGAFIAFYSSPKRADELEGRVRQNSKEAGADVVRHGDVTVVYLANAGRDKVEACLK